MYLTLLTIILNLNFCTLKGPKRPKRIFAVIVRNNQSDIALINRHTGHKVMYTKDSVPETALLCTSDKLIYVSGNKIFWQKIGKPKKAHLLGTLPAGFITSQAGNIRHFLKISNDKMMMAWPDSVGFKVKSFDGKIDLKIIPPTGEKTVHPVYWRPGDNEVFFVTIDSSKHLIFRFRTVAPYKKRLAVKAFPKPIESVESMEAFWSSDGKWLAVNTDVKIKIKGKLKTKRLFFILDASGGKHVKLTKRWKIYKFHGFDNKNNLILTMKRSSSPGIYRLDLYHKLKLKFIDKLYGREIYDFYPARRSFLLYSKWHKCSKPRLISLSMYGKARRLLKWTKWSEVLATDEYKAWAIFRGGSSCKNRKPSLYLMRMDGTLLLREMPARKFKFLRFLSPEQVALCH